MKTRNKLIVGGLAAGALFAGTAGSVAVVVAARRALDGFGRLRRGRAYDAFGLRWLGEGEDLRGQTVLITGGSRGLGLALAEEFALHGCKIALCARNEQELARARQQVEGLGAEVRAVACDVSKPEQVDHLISAVHRQFGRIDILVNNAGIMTVGPLHSHGRNDFHEAMDVIFWGMVNPTLAVLPAMIEHGKGRIINVTSIGGKVSMPHLLPYSAAKFAAVGFSEGLHAEVKHFGVRVLTVVPGLMRTGSHVNARFKGDHRHEYGWFAVAGTNPLLSISAARAARKIVDAARHNRAEVVLGWQAQVLAHAHHISPELSAEVLALVNRLLPKAAREVTEAKRGIESGPAMTRSPLTKLGRKAARRYNQMEESA
jgi:short-subunit dehydrogenase